MSGLQSDAASSRRYDVAPRLAELQSTRRALVFRDGDEAQLQPRCVKDLGRVRFRHAEKFVRRRPDREPSSCAVAQLDVPLNYDVYDALES